MPHETALIATIAAGIGLAFVLGFAATRVRLPPLVGYLLAGVPLLAAAAAAAWAHHARQRARRNDKRLRKIVRDVGREHGYQLRNGFSIRTPSAGREDRH